MPSDYLDYENNLVFPPQEIKSQHELSEQGRQSDVLIKAIDKCEKLEKEIIALNKEYKTECHRADELEDSLHISWQNENKLKKQLKIAIKALKEYADTHRWSDCYLHQENNGLDDFFTQGLYDQYGYSTAEEALKDIKQIGEK